MWSTLSVKNYSRRLTMPKNKALALTSLSAYPRTLATFFEYRSNSWPSFANDRTVRMLLILSSATCDEPLWWWKSQIRSWGPQLCSETQCLDCLRQLHSSAWKLKNPATSGPSRDGKNNRETLHILRLTNAWSNHAPCRQIATTVAQFHAGDAGGWLNWKWQKTRVQHANKLCNA